MSFAMRAILGILLFASMSFAQITTFAQFHQTADGFKRPFEWTNLNPTGAPGGYLAYDADGFFDPIQFRFLVSQSAGLNKIEANVTFDAYTDNVVTVWAGMYLLRLDYGRITIRRNSGDFGILLDSYFKNGIFSAIIGSRGATLQFSTAGGSDVQYTSSVLTFGGRNDFTFSFTGIQPGLSLAPNRQFNNFSMDGAGSFSSDAAIPIALKMW